MKMAPILFSVWILLTSWFNSLREMRGGGLLEEEHHVNSLGCWFLYPCPVCFLLPTPDPDAGITGVHCDTQFENFLCWERAWGCRASCLSLHSTKMKVRCYHGHSRLLLMHGISTTNLAGVLERHLGFLLSRKSTFPRPLPPQITLAVFIMVAA